MSFASYKRVQGCVGLLTLDDGQANSFGHKMLADAFDCLMAAEKDLLDCHGALVLAGNSRLLSGGFDLKTMMKGPDEAKLLINEGAAFIEKLVLFPRPVVVACTGHAVALGALVLLTGDYRIGAEMMGDKPLKIGLNETANNMNLPDFFAEGARAVLAPQYLRESVALGLMFDSARAQVVGFLDEAVPQDKVVDHSVTKAKELAKWCKHPAFKHNKRLVHGPMADKVAKGRREQKPGEELKWLDPITPVHPVSKL